MSSNEVSAPESQGGAVEKLQNNVSQSMGLVYGLGMMTFSGFNQMLTQYWNYFLTNAVGLDPAVMGTITSTASIAAWLFVFIAAIVVEKIWFRWGQYRSYMLIAPPLAFLCILGSWTDWTWLGVQTGSGAQIALLSTCYLLGQFFISLFMISGTSIINVVSHTEADRSLMSTRKAQGNMAIKVLFAAISLPMIIFFAGGDMSSGTKPDTPIGYTITAFIWGIVFVAAFVGLFFMFKGKDPTEEYCQKRREAKKAGKKLELDKKEEPKKVSIIDCIKYFFTNVPALGLWIGEVGRAICTMLLGGMAIYFCTTVYNDPKLYAGMLTAANICGLVATFAGEFLAKKIGNRWTYLVGIAIAFVAMFAGFFVSPVSVAGFTFCVCLSFFGTNMMMAVEFSCMSNAIAYQEWKKGETARAFIMGTIQWCPNIGKICMGAISGFGLAALGYSKGVEVTAAMTHGITFIMFMVPAIVLAICAVLFFFMHRLDSKQMAIVNSDLEKRHKEQEAATQDALNRAEA